MNQSTRLIAEPLQYYATSAYPCSYVPGQRARSLVAAPSEAVDTSTYEQLIQQGFRRSGSFVYRPQCDQCSECLSVRLAVAEFKPRRNQQRAWSQHSNLSATIMAPAFSREHYELYQRYQKCRHPGGGMDVDDESQYADFLVKTNVTSWLVEFRLPSVDAAASGELKMVSIIDKLRDGLSAVYTYYDPAPGLSLGTFNILWQIDRARRLGLRHVYLGYWIRSCAKMAYKTRFQPCEVLMQGEWRRQPPLAS